MAKRWSKSKGMKNAVAKVKAAGATSADGVKDSEIVHVRKDELPIVDRALKRYGGSGKTNPKTGARQYDREMSAEGRAAGPGGPGGASRSGNAGGTKSDKNVPTKNTGPTPSNDTFGSPESAAAANASLGAGGSQALGAATNPNAGNAGPAKSSMPTGVTGMDKAPPRGATPYVEGADAIGIGATIAGGATLGALRALNAGVGNEDPLKDHMGTQTGWSADRDHGVPGDVGGSGGAGGTKGSEISPKPASSASAPKPSTPSTPMTPKPPSGGAAIGGGTITVNPDGTIRTQDTSVAGLRAQKRYGKKTSGVAIPTATA